jgi:acetolactate synthase-1/2/3 large subunit
MESIFLGFPKDVGLAEFPGEPSKAWGKGTPMGAAHQGATTKAAELINTARQPVF